MSGHRDPKPENGALPFTVVLPFEPSSWPAPWREEYEERAAIMEYDGGLPRAKAERFAERCVRLRAAG